jgi:uncharacterized membrane protein YcfT
MSNCQNSSSVEKQRLAWVDLAKGICIIGVITMYAAHKMKDNLGGVGWMEYWVAFAKPFRMPDFFLLSGLFLGRVIDRPLRQFLDRRVVHYLYFFVLWSLIIYGFRIAALAVGIYSPEKSMGSLLWNLIEPFGKLWFIQLLPLLAITVRLLRNQNPWVVLSLAAILQILPIEFGPWSQVGNFCERFVYFLVGYQFGEAIIALANWANERTRTTAALALLWIGTNSLCVSTGIAELPVAELLLGLWGCLGVIFVATLVTDLASFRWLGYLGETSLVAYLGFAIPLEIIAVVARKVSFLLDAGTLTMLVAMGSLLAAHAQHQMVRWNFLRFLFERPSWIAIPKQQSTGETLTPAQEAA